MGVFATRAPYRPNPLALTCVKIDRIDFESVEGPVIHVRGADLMDGTPVYDIKPYLAYADSIPDAVGGFTDAVAARRLDAEIPEEFAKKLPEDVLNVLRDVLEQDPRPRYHDDPDRVYVLPFAEVEVSFKVCGERLTVTDIK